MHIANKVRFDFDTHDFTFNNKFPDGEIREVMSQDEFDDIMNKINVEFAERLHKNATDIQKWFKVVGFGSLFLVGIFFLPVLMSKTNKQSKYLSDFHDDVKEYLYRMNKKKFLKRKIEWKLVRDKKLAKGKDAGNIEAQMHVEIVFESTSAKRDTEAIQAYTPLQEEPLKKPKKQKLTLYDSSSSSDEGEDAFVIKDDFADTSSEPVVTKEEESDHEEPEIEELSETVEVAAITETEVRKDPVVQERKRKERHHHRRHHHRSKSGVISRKHGSMSEREQDGLSAVSVNA